VLTRQELEKNPLFQDITYESYLQMLTCFQAVQKSYRSDEVLYDFTDPRSNSVGILERGTAALIRIDEEGVTTVLEELVPGGVFGRSPALGGTVWKWWPGLPVMWPISTIPTFSSGVRTPAHTIACWCRTCCG
jgi:CRP-like cAMP-binding protein